MKKLQKGFTLIELMIVVAIIAILAAVAAPKFGVQLRKSHDAKGLAIIGALRSAAQMGVADSTDPSNPTIPTYGALRLAIDSKSQVLVVSGTTGSHASVRVGTNTVTTGTHDGLTETATTVLVGTPDSEGIISIVSTGLDSKGTSWSAY